MKPTLALRCFLLGRSLPTAIASFCFLNPSAYAANIWDGGGVDNSTLTANNWDNNLVPTGGTGVLTFAGSTRPSVVWDGVNSVAPVNFYGITFAVGASAFTINTGTQTSFQFTNPGNSSIILNSSSNLQTLKPIAYVFFNGTKTIDGSSSGLALDGGISFRGDSLSGVQSNKLILTGTADSTTSSIGQLGAYAPGTTNSLTKNGSGKWTVTGDATYVGATTISAGTLEFGGSISSSSITNNSAMILNNSATQSYANNITGSGTLTKRGAGTFTLSSGSNSYSGATNIAAGKLTIGSTGNINTTSGITIGTTSTAATSEFNYNSSTALTKPVSFAAASTGGTLSGSGTINQTVNITTGNTLSIGNSVGQMNFGNALTLAGTDVVEIDGTAGPGVAGGHDFANVTGALTYGGALSLDFGTTFGIGSYSWNLFDFAGADLGTFASITLTDQYAGSLLDLDTNGIWDLTSGSNTWQFTESTGVLGLTVIPEPGSALLGSLGLLALLRRRR